MSGEYIYIDEWKQSTSPIRIPKKEENVIIGTYKNTYSILVSNVSKDIVQGKVISSPPKDKHFKKGDKVIFHLQNILPPHHYPQQTRN